MSRIARLVLVVLVAAAGYAGYRVLEKEIAIDVYRDRVAQLGADYEALRSRYNDAVRSTAVTELVVQDGRVAVSIRTAAGVLQTIPTGFDASKEVYVDYVMLGGRLWIRRVFDEDTPPGNGVVIDPKLVDIDWDDDGASHGKAAYRPLGEGRWVVTVTGGGSLGLERVEEGETVILSPPPAITQYEPIEAEVDQALREAFDRIRPGEVLAALARRVEGLR